MFSDVFASPYIVVDGRRLLRAAGGEAQAGEAPATPAPEPSPAPTQVATPEPAAPETPWADKLQSRFDDPEIRTKVDEFLREDVQPYVTKLEQGTQTDSDIDEGLRNFWEDLQAEPAKAYAQLTGELFDEDAAQVVIDALQAHYGEVTPQESGEQLRFADPETDLPPGDPSEWEQVKNIVLGQKMQDDYDEELERVKRTELKGLDTGKNDAWFHPFVVANEGDFDAAAVEYKEWLGQVREKFSPEPAPEAPVAPDTGGEAPAAPPVQKDYGSDLGAAIDDFLSDNRTAPPPPVGAS